MAQRPPEPKQTNFGATKGMWKALRAERAKSRKESRARVESAGHKIYGSIDKIGEDFPKTPEEVQQQIGVDQIHWSKLKVNDIPKERWFGNVPDWSVRKNMRTNRKTGELIGVKK